MKESVVNIHKYTAFNGNACAVVHMSNFIISKQISKLPIIHMSTRDDGQCWQLSIGIWSI